MQCTSRSVLEVHWAAIIGLLTVGRTLLVSLLVAGCNKNHQNVVLSQFHYHRSLALLDRTIQSFFPLIVVASPCSIRHLASSSRIRDHRRAHVVHHRDWEVPFRIGGDNGGGMRANVSRFHVVALLKPRRIPRPFVSISARCRWTNHCER